MVLPMILEPAAFMFHYQRRPAVCFVFSSFQTFNLTVASPQQCFLKNTPEYISVSRVEHMSKNEEIREIEQVAS